MRSVARVTTAHRTRRANPRPRTRRKRCRSGRATRSAEVTAPATNTQLILADVLGHPTLPGAYPRRTQNCPTPSRHIEPWLRSPFSCGRPRAPARGAPVASALSAGSRDPSRSARCSRTASRRRRSHGHQRGAPPAPGRRPVGCRRRRPELLAHVEKRDCAIAGRMCGTTTPIPTASSRRATCDSTASA